MIEIHTENPQGLIESINKAIRIGEIVTWSVDAEGDYTHALDQWKEKAWLRCDYDVEDEHLLRFIIIEPRMQKLTKSVYAVYHGRFSEMLLAHFDTEINSLSISPLLTKYDLFSKEQELPFNQ